MLVSGLIIAGGLGLGAKVFQRRRPQKNLEAVPLSREENPANDIKQPFRFSTILSGSPSGFPGLEEQRQKLSDLRKNSMSPATTAEANDFALANREINRYLAVSGTGLGLAAAGLLVYPPLSLLSLPVTLYACLPIFRETYQSLVKERRLRAPVLDSIAVIGALAAHYYTVMAFATCLYFTGRKLLLKTEDNSRKSLINIFGEQPRSVWLWRDGVEIQVPFEEVQSGNVIVVNAGEVIPADGVIVEGVASIDQHRLTGESQPGEKGPGEPVLAATFILTGRILVQVEKAGAESVAAQIGEILNHTADYKSTVEARSQQLADRSVLPTLGIGSLAFLTQGLVGGVAVISANFSEVLRVAAPLGMLNFLSLATQNGILIKDGRSLELLRQVDTVIFDKTGTLTLEQPQLGQIYSCNRLTEDALLAYAAAAEHRQTHPIAKAIQLAAQERDLCLPSIDQASYEVGYGLRAWVEEQWIRVGSARFMDMEQIAISDEMKNIQETAHALGNSLIFVAVDDRIEGAIELQPTLRPEAKAVIQQLKERRVSLYIISGDHEQPTRNLAAQLGIDHYFAEVLPEGKANLVKKLQQEGRFICFVGDGINDSIALKTAQVSISIRGASTVATDTAQIVLMDGSLSQLTYLFQLAQDLNTNMKTTLALTLGPGVICVGGVFFLHFGILSSVILYNLSLVASVSNVMLPWLRRQPSASSHRAGDVRPTPHSSGRESPEKES